MKSEHAQQIEELFHAAREVETDRRGAFLSAVCGTDESLRRSLESMLAWNGKAENFMESNAMALVARELTPDYLPAAIGPYRILRVLGEGGMGVVYEAEQQQPRRTVALKVIKPGLAGLELLRRFEFESQALARLHHPGIAQIYDAGTADTGLGPQPYFAMELVHGRSLLDYVNANELNTRQRLELFIAICAAVQHAHEKGLIHRDLKPGNILVDETGQPKILDFGVARLTDPGARNTRHTDLGQQIGTLSYMSPEQVRADPSQLDTRSDVYTLGVILFEILSGRLPYRLSSQPHQAARTICEEDPIDLGSIHRDYRGDLATIAAKALEKDSSRRYASPADLANDIQHYLRHEPIMARPQTATYQLGKFAQRNRSLVVGAFCVFITLIGGFVSSARQAARAARERDRATIAETSALRERDRARSAEQAAHTAEARAIEQRNYAIQAMRRADTESATAKAISDFLQNDLLAQASAITQARPNSNPDKDLKVRTALDRAAAGIGGKFKAQPLVEASLRQTIAKTYYDLGLYPESQRHTERALDLRRQTLGAHHPDTLASMNQLANVYLAQGKYAAAEALLSSLTDNRETLDTLHALAQMYHYRGNFAQAQPLYLKVLDLRRRTLGPHHPDTLATINDLAVLYRDLGRYSQAEKLAIPLVETTQRVLGSGHPLALSAINNLAVLYQVQSKYSEAEPLATRLVDARRRVLGERHPNTLTAINNLAALYAAKGRYADAEPLFAEVLESRSSVLGDQHPTTLNTMFHLAEVYRDQGNLISAERLASTVLDARRRVLGDEHPDTLISMEELAALYGKQRRYDEAASLASRVLAIDRRVLGSNHPDTLHTMMTLAEIRLAQQLYRDSELVLRELLAAYDKTAPDTWKRYRCRSMLGASLAGQQLYAEAEPLLLSGYEGMLKYQDRVPAANRAELEQVRNWIARLYDSTHPF